jgi:anti-sigma regulatory factor (Ser/Thr protein kinase)
MALSEPQEDPGTRTYRRIFPGRPDQIGEVRRFIREHLAGHHRMQDITLVASELTTNAWEHTHSSAQHGTFSVCARLRPDDTIRLEVEDHGGRLVFGQPKPHKEGGRGLGIVDALTVEWGVAGDASGRVVWAEFK